MSKDNRYQTLEDFIKKMKSVFPFVENPYEDRQEFTHIKIGSSDTNYFLVRINYEKWFIDQVSHDKRFGKVTIGLFDIFEQNQHIIDCTFNFDELQRVISKILKKKNNIELEKKTSLMKSNLDSMMLCGFLTTNNFEFSIEKKDDRIFINIFGTIFEKLIIRITPEGYKRFSIIIPQSKELNIKQVEKFIVTCRELNVSET